MLAIYKREMKSYFTSMIGCVFVAFLVAFTGLYFMVYNLNSGYPYFAIVLESVVFVFIIAIPILTMRSFAEEHKNKTDQLLFTAPICLTKVVLGKYFAMVTMLAIPNLIFCLFPIIIKMQGTAHLGVDYATILAFFLMGCVFIGIGMFISALTESQIIAAIGTFGVLFLIYMWEGILQYLPTAAMPNAIALAIIFSAIVYLIYHMTGNYIIAGSLEVVVVIGMIVAYLVKSSLFESAISKLLEVFALSITLRNFAENYVFDVAGMVLLLSLIVVFIFLTIQTLQKRRWS